MRWGALLVLLLSSCGEAPDPVPIPVRLQVCPDRLPAPAAPKPPHDAKQVDTYMRTLIRWGEGNGDRLDECRHRLDERAAMGTAP